MHSRRVWTEEHYRLGQPEIEHLGPSIAARWSECTGALEDDVGRLQVAMGDPFVVRSLERLGDLACDGQCFGDLHWPLAQPIRERRAFDEFEDQRAQTIGFFKSIDAADVRMIQRGEHARFAREAGTTLRIRCEMRRQEFEGDVTAELAVVRAKHLAHTPCAKRSEDPVGTEVASQHLRESGRTGQPSELRRCRGLEEFWRLRCVAQQRSDFFTQAFVAGACVLQPRSHYSARRSSAAVMDGRCSSRRPPSSREGQEHRAGSSAEPERYCDYRNSRTRSRSQQDGRRGGTRGSGSDRARRTPGRDPRGTRGAVPGHHDYQRAENGGCSEPEISEVVAGVDGPHEPEDHWRRGKERRTEQQ